MTTAITITVASAAAAATTATFDFTWPILGDLFEVGDSHPKVNHYELSE